MRANRLGGQPSLEELTMYLGVNKLSLIGLLVACNASGQAIPPLPPLPPETQSLTIQNEWISSISLDGTFSYAVCPISQTRVVNIDGVEKPYAGCRAPTKNPFLLLLDFKQSVPYIPLDKYLNHVTVDSTSITEASIRDRDLVVHYTGTKRDIVHAVYNSGWLKVSDGKEETYLVCPGTISKKGDNDFASSYQCEFQNKLFPLKYVKNSIAEYKNRHVIKQSIMEVGNSIDVYSVLGAELSSTDIKSYPKLNTLKVIDASNETKPSFMVVLIYLFGSFTLLGLAKKSLFYIYNNYVNPPRRISPPSNGSSTNLVEGQMDTRPQIERTPTSQLEREYALLLEYQALNYQRAPTAAHAARLAEVQEILNLNGSPSSYVTHELNRMRTLLVAPRRPHEYAADLIRRQARSLRTSEVSATVRPVPSTTSNDPAPTPPRGRKIYVD